MRIAIEVDERAFLHPNSKARRDIEQAQTREVVLPSSGNLIDVLLSAPEVGDDADFERVQDLGRPGLTHR
jgi:hypothetical protein